MRAWSVIAPGRSRGRREDVSLRGRLLRVVAGTPPPPGAAAAVLVQLGSALVRRDQLAALAPQGEV